MRNGSMIYLCMNSGQSIPFGSKTDITPNMFYSFAKIPNLSETHFSWIMVRILLFSRFETLSSIHEFRFAQLSTENGKVKSPALPRDFSKTVFSQYIPNPNSFFS